MLMLAGMSVSSFADDELTIGESGQEISGEKGLYLATEAVPNDASDFAIEVFESLDSDYLSALELMVSPSDLYLAQGFVMENTEVPQYYFPILEGDTVVAMMIITDNGGNYGFQLGITDLAENLNTIQVDSNNPAKVIVTDNGCYAVDSESNVSVLDTDPEVSDDIIKSESEMLAQETLSIADQDKLVINISKNTAYDAKISDFDTYALMQKDHKVAQVDNWTYTTTDGVRHGTCWASCVGSLVDYYLNGVNASEGTADYYRTKAKDEQKRTTGSYGANYIDAATYINKYAKSSISCTKKLMSWQEIKTALNSKPKLPFYSRWATLNEDAFHAMVIRGYRYDNAQPNNEQLYSIILMDPNEKTPQILQYRSSYTISKRLYSWEGSAY